MFVCFGILIETRLNTRRVGNMMWIGDWIETNGVGQDFLEFLRISLPKCPLGHPFVACSNLQKIGKFKSFGFCFKTNLPCLPSSTTNMAVD